MKLDRFGCASFVALLVFLHFGLTNRCRGADPPAKANSPARPADLQQKVWLTDLPEQDVKVGYGSFGKHGQTGFGGGPIRLNGIPSPHGLGTHPNSSVTYLLGKKYRSLRGAAAVNDSTRGFGRRVFFVVEADGKEVWRSWGFHYAHDCQAFALDVTGIDRLTLQTIYDPKSTTPTRRAHVVWLEPYVSKAPCDADLLAGLRTENIHSPYARRVFESRLAGLLFSEKFDELEKLAAECKTSRGDLDAEPRIHWYYHGLSHADQANEDEQNGRLAHLEAWHKAKPNSAIPQIASAEIWLDMAENILHRGTRRPGDEGIRLANDRIRNAADSINDAQQLNPQDPEVYVANITLAAMEDQPSERIDALLDDALTLDPHYSSASLARAATLLPHRGGKPSDIEQLASAIRTRLGGRDGEVAYAQIAMVALHADPKEYGGQFKLKRIRPALLAYCRRYAAARPLVQECCHAACLAGDFETARTIFDQIPPGDVEAHVWKSAQKMEEWRGKVNKGQSERP